MFLFCKVKAAGVKYKCCNISPQCLQPYIISMANEGSGKIYVLPLLSHVPAFQHTDRIAIVECAISDFESWFSIYSQYKSLL